MAQNKYPLNITKTDETSLNIHEFLPHALPSRVDLRKFMPHIYDQLQLASCTANALVACYEYLTPKFIGSRMFLYYNELKYEGGAIISDGIRALEKYGVCPEMEYPYIPAEFTKTPSPLCYSNALKHKVVHAVNIACELNAIKTCLSNGFPFIVGIEIYSSFESQSVASSGIIPMPSPTDTLLGGHAVCIVGYDDSRSIFIGRNSWGKSWGDRGYFYIPYDYLTNATLSSDIWALIKNTTSKYKNKN